MWQLINSNINCPAGASCSFSGNYMVINWAIPGSYTWMVPTGVTSVQYLVVGGGGSGGSHAAGGGGAGGFRDSVPGEITGGGGSAVPVLCLTPGNSIAITVGAGGLAPTELYASGKSGAASSIATGNYYYCCRWWWRRWKWCVWYRWWFRRRWGEQ